MSLKVNNLITRTLTGIIFLLAIICSALWNQLFFTALFLGFLILGQLEYYRLLKGFKVYPQIALGLLSGITLFLTFSFFAMNMISYKWIFINLPVLMMVFIAELYSHRENPFQNAAFTISGVIYIALPFALLSFFFNPFFRNEFYHPEILLSFFFISWMNDIGAYLIGSAFGKHRLFERISPKKSWEGSFGGLLFSVITAVVCAQFFTIFPLWQWFTISLIIVVTGTYGDLVESMFKRSLNIKDSGKIMPGHGGILDRFDAVFFAAPFVLLFIILMNI